MYERGRIIHLGTLLIRRLDTANSVLASQQSQLTRTSRSDAIAQLADAAKATPVHNQPDRSLPDSIERSQAQVPQRARQPATTTELQPGATQRTARPTPDTSTTPSAPTTLGQAARTILALLALFPDSAPVQGRSPLLQTNAAGGQRAPATPAGAQPGASIAQPNTPSGRAPSAQSTISPSPRVPTPVAGPSVAGAAPSIDLAASLVRALTATIEQSGLFYESHLREWMSGVRSLAQLQQEPQALLSRPHAAPTSSQSPPSGQTGFGTLSATSTDGTPNEARMASPATVAGGPSTNASLTSNPVHGVHPDSQPVLRQQLDVLATQVFSWNGAAWPDAPMEWEISRHNHEGMADETGAHWATTLTLSLPTLGKVEARLAIHESQVVMQLTAPDSAHTLSGHDQELRAALLQAGLTLSQLSIQDEP